jgi:hypothetical protein
LAVKTDNAVLNNYACWYGATDGPHFAEIVLPACERAVELASEVDRGFYQDSRGLARALTGDISGAIEDFELFLEWSKDRDWLGDLAAKREVWVDELKAGENPFDAATLAELRREH